MTQGVDYTDWSELVLKTLNNLAASSSVARHYGTAYDQLPQLIWGENFETLNKQLGASDLNDIIWDVLYDLHSINLVEDPNDQFIRLERKGRTASGDNPALWKDICLIKLDDELRRILSIVNRHSPKQYDHFARVEFICTGLILGELCDATGAVVTREDVEEYLRELKKKKLVWWDGGDLPDKVRATYAGLVREARYDQVIKSEFIDNLIVEWETTNVDFKRELCLTTKKQKAEFAKDVMGLATTKSSGRRYLIIGFDDKTRAYHGAPDPAVTQNRIEQILADLTAPVVTVRYETVDYRLGKVGKLEVIREPEKVPYRAAKDVFDENGQKKLEAGKVYVRHGSHTYHPTADEMQSLENEGLEARRHQTS